MFYISIIVKTICIAAVALYTEISSIPNYVEVQNALLSISEIEEVYLYSPVHEEGYKLSEEEVLEFASLLAKVELKGNGSKSYLEYMGGVSKMFRIVYNGGTQIEFAAVTPFYIIDSWGYEGEYRPCDTISSLYWELLPKYDPYFRYLYRYRTE